MSALIWWHRTPAQSHCSGLSHIPAKHLPYPPGNSQLISWFSPLSGESHLWAQALVSTKASSVQGEQLVLLWWQCHYRNLVWRSEDKTATFLCQPPQDDGLEYHFAPCNRTPGWEYLSLCCDIFVGDKTLRFVLIQVPERCICRDLQHAEFPFTRMSCCNVVSRGQTQMSEGNVM